MKKALAAILAAFILSSCTQQSSTVDTTPPEQTTPAVETYIVTGTLNVQGLEMDSWVQLGTKEDQSLYYAQADSWENNKFTLQGVEGGTYILQARGATSFDKWVVIDDNFVVDKDIDIEEPITITPNLTFASIHATYNTEKALASEEKGEELLVHVHPSLENYIAYTETISYLDNFVVGDMIEGEYTLTLQRVSNEEVLDDFLIGIVKVKESFDPDPAKNRIVIDIPDSFWE